MELSGKVDERVGIAVVYGLANFYGTNSTVNFAVN
jgi:hypothetical protein